MIFIVLGMHKSGTTLVSQILHESGINMGWDITEELMDYSVNQCESPNVNQINDDILKSHGTHSLKLSKPKKLNESPKVQKRIGDFVSKQEDFEHWGFKDPRTCLSYEVWNEHLPDHRLIITYREIDEVVWHYEKNPGWSFIKKRRAKKRWIEYNQEILHIIEDPNFDHEKFIVLKYDELMEGDIEFKRLEEFVGFELNDMRNKDMYRSKPSGNKSVSNKVGNIYQRYKKFKLLV